MRSCCIDTGGGCGGTDAIRWVKAILKGVDRCGEDSVNGSGCGGTSGRVRIIKRGEKEIPRGVCR